MSESFLFLYEEGNLIRPFQVNSCEILLPLLFSNLISVKKLIFDFMTFYYFLEISQKQDKIFFR